MTGVWLVMGPRFNTSQSIGRMSAKSFLAETDIRPTTGSLRYLYAWKYLQALTKKSKLLSALDAHKGRDFKAAYAASFRGRTQFVANTDGLRLFSFLILLSYSSISCGTMVLVLSKSFEIPMAGSRRTVLSVSFFRIRFITLGLFSSSIKQSMDCPIRNTPTSY